MPSSTTMPRLICRPPLAASAVLGRTPTAITTSPHGSTRPSFSSTASTRRARRGWRASPRPAARARPWPRSHRRAARRPRHRAGAPSAGPSGARASPAMPRRASPYAASMPSSPPPITTAGDVADAAGSRLAISASERNVMTPARSLPGSGRRIGSEPVASSSLSNASSSPLPSVTVRLSHIDGRRRLPGEQRDAVLRVPVARPHLRRRAAPISPASSDDSSTRL